MNDDENESMTNNDHEYDSSVKHEEMNNLSMNVNNIEWRRNKVYELHCKNFTEIEIAKKLAISQATVSRDIKCVREEIYAQRVEWGDEQVIDHQKYIVAMEAVAKSLWEESEKPNIDPKDRIRIAPLIMRCHADIRKAKAEEPDVIHRRNYLKRIMHNESEVDMKKNKRKTELEGVSNSDLGLPDVHFRT